LRTSRRDRIITSAIRVIEDRGVEALSFETLAEAAGLSKSGIIYHFPTRQDLLLAINQYFIDTWEAQLEDIAGAPATDLDPGQRLRAVVLSMRDDAEPAELLMCLESRRHPELPEMWAALEDQWMVADPRSELYPVQLMAYGLWAHDHVHHSPLSEADRAHLVDAILRQIPGLPLDFPA